MVHRVGKRHEIEVFREPVNMNINEDDNVERAVKIKRLLELARHNGNAYEAAVALARAQKLMRKYGMTDEDLELSSIGELKKDTVCGLKDKETIYLIAAICASAFGMQNLINYCGKSCVGVTFIGVKDDLELVGYVYDFLCRQILNAKADYQAQCKRRLRKKAQDWVERHMPEGSELESALKQHGMDPFDFAYKYLKCKQSLRLLTKSYVLGYLQAVEDKVRAFYDARTNQLIEIYKNKHHGNLEKIKHKEIMLDSGAVNAGFNDGERVNLLQPVNGQAQSSLIGHRQ